MAGGNAKVQGLFTHVWLDKVERHGYHIQKVKVTEVKVKM